MANDNNLGNQPLWRLIVQGVGTMALGGALITIGNAYLSSLDQARRIEFLENKKIPPQWFQNEVRDIKEELEETEKELYNLQSQINELQTHIFGGRR